MSTTTIHCFHSQRSGLGVTRIGSGEFGYVETIESLDCCVMQLLHRVRTFKIASKFGGAYIMKFVESRRVFKACSVVQIVNSATTTDSGAIVRTHSLTEQITDLESAKPVGPNFKNQIRSYFAADPAAVVGSWVVVNVVGFVLSV